MTKGNFFKAKNESMKHIRVACDNKTHKRRKSLSCIELLRNRIENLFK